MFCTNCGNKNKEGCKFCTNCGFSIGSISSKENNKILQHEKWWHRLLKIMYIVSYLPLLIIIPVVWGENSYYSYVGGDNYSDSFWYSVLTLVIYVVAIRLIKLAVIYIVFGRKPKWKEEFKNIF